MNLSTHTSEPGDIDDYISKNFGSLSFSRDRERQFEIDVQTERCDHMIKNNIVGLCVYNFFLIGDYRCLHDVFTADLIVHLAVVTPLWLAVNGMIRRHPPVWLREGLAAFVLVVIAGTVVALLSASHSPDRDIKLLQILLLNLFATVMQRLRFRYALTTCLAVQLCCIHGFATLAPFSLDRMLQFDTFFAGVTLFSLFACYHFEREHRLGYLLRRRDRLRNGELEIMSCRDALTGIGNRRALEAALKRGATGDDAGTPRNTAVILVDIDHFKLFNDTNGHQEGDACLKRVASLIVASLEGRQGVAYRFGGEEFLVLLDDATLDEAVSVAETIRRHVADARIPRAVHANTVVTVSAGVAVGTIGHGVTAETVIADADGSLYAAKREGRDLVRSTSRDTQEQAPAAALMETPRLVA